MSPTVCSIISLVRPYGLIGAERRILGRAASSLRSPYTVADELKTIRVTPCRVIASSRTMVPYDVVLEVIAAAPPPIRRPP